MERERWERVYRLLLRLDKRLARGIFCDALIVAVYFWAVIHDRPVCWACCAKHWPADLQGRLPSQSTMSRRMKSQAIQGLLDQVGAEASRGGNDVEGWVKVVDGKPLPVGGHSKDPEARWGRGVRSWMKGYKLFAIWAKGPMPLA